MTSSSGVSPEVKGADFESRHPTIGQYARYARRFVRHRSGVFGVVIFAVLVMLAIFGPVLSPYDFDDPDFTALSVGPSAAHWFGTDQLGNDVFTQAVHGLGHSLVIGIVVSFATTLIAGFAGACAACFGGWLERAILTVIHLFLVLPSFLILAIVSSSVGGNWLALIGLLTIFGWFLTARVVWTLCKSLREQDYVTAARALGVPRFSLVIRHILPNCGSLLTITFALGVVITIQAETALSFIGFGVQAPDVSLGTLIATGTSVVVGSPWQFYFPAATLTLITVSMTLIANGLRDALDPAATSSGVQADIFVNSDKEPAPE